jgi:hypothetical protein
MLDIGAGGRAPSRPILPILLQAAIGFRMPYSAALPAGRIMSQIGHAVPSNDPRNAREANLVPCLA